MSFSIEEYKEVKRKAEEDHKFLFGNGELGLDEKFRAIEKEIEMIKQFIIEYQKDRKEAIEKREEEQKKADERREEERKWLKRAVATPAIGAIVMLVFNGLVFIVTWAIFIPVMQKFIASVP